MNASVVEHRVSAPTVNLLARKIKVLLEKGDRAADKAQQFYVAAGQHLKELKAQWPNEWEQIVREQCNLGRSRAYEIMAIADGRTTVEKIRAVDAEKKRISREESKKIRPGRPGQEVVSTLSEVADETGSIDDEISDRPALPNGARAIMASRQEPDDSLDFFPTPPWAGRGLTKKVLPVIGIRQLGYVWEPACGEGHIAEVLREDTDTVVATDIKDYGYEGCSVEDFLKARSSGRSTQWIITNPPFGDKAIEFVKIALDLAQVGVAMFFRSQWVVEGIERYEAIFRDRPPTVCAFFVERVPLYKGRWDPDGTTATAYCWLVWLKGRAPRAPLWIPPCRKELTYPDDEERFTKHPVIKKQHKPPRNPETGGIIEPGATPSVAAARSADDSLDLPDFLRRGDPANDWMTGGHAKKRFPTLIEDAMHAIAEAQR
jgi:hypothetical protein